MAKESMKAREVKRAKMVAKYAEKMDGRGNYTLGLKEQIIFPEIDMDKNPRIHGMEITFVTTARSDEEAHALLKAMGLPFKKHNN